MLVELLFAAVLFQCQFPLNRFQAYLILNEFATLISNSNNKAFKSNNLEKTLILHNEMADDFIEEHNLLESDEYHAYEIKDSKNRTTVTVNEYRNIP